MSGTGAEVDVGTMTVSELLGTYARILAELRRREVVRTYNAPVGDYVELLVASALGGTLASSTSERSWDIATDEWGKVQVKGRAVALPISRKGETQTSPFRSWDFDHAALVMVDRDDYSIHAAHLLPMEVVREQSVWKSSVSGWVTWMHPSVTASDGVVDITELVSAAAADV